MKRPTFTPRIRITGPDPYQVVEKSTTKNYEITKRENGYRLSLSNRLKWPGISGLWKKYEIEEVSLGGVLGWRETNISFLHDLPAFSRLILRPAGDLTWNTVEQLSGLAELLIVTTPIEPQEILDFSRLERLRCVEVPWWPQWSSVLSNRHIQSLQIQDAKAVREFDLRRMKDLLELRFVRCRSLQKTALSEQKLNALEISLCPKFSEIEPETALASIEYLQLHGRLTWDYRQIRRFRNLRQLTLAHMGKLPTLGFLRDLKRLEYVDFGYPTSVEDGDLRFLDDLPRLKAASYDKSKKHYFPRRPESWWDELKERREAEGWNF